MKKQSASCLKNSFYTVGLEILHLQEACALRRKDKDPTPPEITSKPFIFFHA